MAQIRRALVPALLAWVLASSVLAGEFPFETDSLDRGDFSRMSMLYRRGPVFLRVDAMELDVRFGSEDAERLRRIAATGPRSAGLEGRLAGAALEATNVLVRLRFLREIDVRRFVNEARRSTRRVYEAGVIDRGTYLEISRNLPHWYGFLEERNIQPGDEMLYRIHEDRLHSVYRGAGGRVLQEQIAVDSRHCRSVLGSYFVPRSEFRRGLIDSLFRD